MIGIIDYGMGNLRSVQKAFEHVGATAALLTDADQSDKVDQLVLPGVGAFADGMEHLRQRGWIEPIKRFIASGKPFLGICLGMQLLFESSEEDAPSLEQPVPGLAVLPGRVVRFAPSPTERFKVPHMGWNAIRWRRSDPLMRGLEQGSAVYFVHSYFPSPRGDAVTSSPVSATTEYPAGKEFCSSIWCNNVWATQFHPEKSQTVGLMMLANFAALR